MVGDFCQSVALIVELEVVDVTILPCGVVDNGHCPCDAFSRYRGGIAVEVVFVCAVIVAGIGDNQVSIPVLVAVFGDIYLAELILGDVF